MEIPFDNAPDLGKQLSIVTNNNTKRSIEIDVAKYQAYLDDEKLTDIQKEEIVRALWSIITSFVDLGFGVHPLQEFCGQEACGKVTPGVDHSPDQDSNTLRSKPVPLKDEFKNAAGKIFDPVAGGPSP